MQSMPTFIFVNYMYMCSNDLHVVCASKNYTNSTTTWANGKGHQKDKQQPTPPRLDYNSMKEIHMYIQLYSRCLSDEGDHESIVEATVISSTVKGPDTCTMNVYMYMHM